LQLNLREACATSGDLPMPFTSSVRTWLQGPGLWVFTLIAWCATRYFQLEILGRGTGNDVWLYLRYAGDWASGAAPYVDFHPEYPPGSLPVFMAPYLVFGRHAYDQSFAIAMGVFDGIACLLAVAWTRRQSGLSARAPWLAALFYLASSTALFPVLLTRFDLVPGVLLLAALYATCSPGGNARGALLLGIAGGVKLWPFALVPLWCLRAFRRGGLRGAFGTGMWLVAGGLLIALPCLPRAGLHVLDFLRYHADRGIQIECTWSTFALIINALHIASADVVHEYGAFHVAGPLASVFAKASVPALLALALAPQVLAFRNGLGGERDADGRIAMIAALGSVLGFMVGGKVLSPQYMLWVLPLLPAFALGAATRAARVVLPLAALAVCGLTTLVYPYWSPALEMREPGHEAALFAVGSRNLLLFAAYICTLWSLRRPVKADG
jgi:hypothetical protein